MVKWLVGLVVFSTILIAVGVGLSTRPFEVFAQMVFFLLIVPLGVSGMVNALRDRGPSV